MKLTNYLHIAVKSKNEQSYTYTQPKTLLYEEQSTENLKN